jgi:HK97 family phage major capsid protein
MAKTKREQLEKLVSDMKTLADDIDSRDDVTPDEVKKLNDMGAEVRELTETIKAEASATGTLDMAKAFLGDLAGAPVEKPSDGPKVKDGIVDPQGMTLGEALVKSPAYEDFLSQFKGADGRIREVTGVKSANFDIPGFRDLGNGVKTVVTGDSATSGGAFITPTRYPVVSDLIGTRELSIRDLCTNITIASDSFEFVTITAKTNNAATVPEATTAADPAANFIPAGAEIVDGGYKPESAMALAVVSAPVETIAHLIPITRRAAADAPQVRQLVDAFLLDGLAEEEEDQILNGNGTSPNIRGILQTVGISTVGSAGTDLDAIVDAIRTIRADRRRPTGLVINPADWYSTGFLLAKDSAGNYLIGDPSQSVDAMSSLWGLRVVVTEAMTANTALVGDFSQYVVADREQSAIYVTDSHKDWFQRNLLAVLAEERLAGGCLDPDAFCTVTAV